MTAERPNIVLIMCDQMRWDAAGFAGSPTVRTPNLDRLAASGVCFENAYCASPVCSPARASWLTGLYSHAHLQLRNYGPGREGGVRCLPAGGLHYHWRCAQGGGIPLRHRRTVAPGGRSPPAARLHRLLVYLSLPGRAPGSAVRLFRTGRGAQPVSLRRAGYDSVREHPRVRHHRGPPAAAHDLDRRPVSRVHRAERGCPVLPVCERKGSASPNPGTARAAGELPRRTDAAVRIPCGIRSRASRAFRRGGSSAFTPR